MNSNYMFDSDLPDAVNLIIREMVAGMLLSDQLSKEGLEDERCSDWSNFTSTNELIRLCEMGYSWEKAVYETMLKCFEIFANMLGTYIFWLPQDTYLYKSWMTGNPKSDARIARKCFTGIVKRLVKKFSMTDSIVKSLKEYLYKGVQAWEFQVCLNTNEKWISDIISDLADLVDWSC